MAYHILTIICLVLAALSVLFALKTLFHRHWILGWLRGTFGILLIVLAISSAIVALDISSYSQLEREQPIASLSFEKLSQQKYKAILVEPNGKESQYTIYGDLWQIDARIIKWSKPIAGMGVKPGYRLGRLTGRYYSLEQERNGERAVYELHSKDYGIDVWSWLKQNPLVPWIDTLYGNATFLPMSDGALFSINLSGTGLLARPLNEAAEKSVSQWQ